MRIHSLLALCAGCAATVALVVALPPADAWAWGPGVHLAMGSYLLDNISLLPVQVATVLAAHAEPFLYGALSADIFIGKGSRFTLGHSHSWDTAFALLHAAEEERRRAFAFGYLAHLAADVVAHNYYVPNVLAAHPTRGKWSHVYVESRADAKVEWDRALAARLFRKRLRRSDRQLLAATGKQVLTYVIKKGVYGGSVRLVGRTAWRRLVASADAVLPMARADRFLEWMLALALAVALDCLKNPERSRARLFDPIGSRNLALVKGMEGRVRRRDLLEAPPYAPDPRLTALLDAAGFSWLPAQG
ncbi:MAG: zinc dependent phospholipase C family protein [Desulfovibrionaceae bacterium]